jgi:signal transduction histidine kinase/two-component SAPR family response regulator
MASIDMNKAVLASTGTNSAAGSAATQDALGQPARVLVVDDDERNLQAISEVLENTAEVLCARSGEEALRALLKDEFAVIILDVLMPGLDGYETAQIIRKREQSKRTPIIFLTAINKEDAHMLRGYDAGAVDYVFKPVDPSVIRSKVAVFVDLFEKTREIRRKAALEQRLLEENLREKSERLVAEQALRQAEKRQEAILRSLPICFHSRSAVPPFGALFVSEAVERLTGFPPERLVQEPDFGLSRVHPEDQPQVIEALTAAQRVGSYSCEFRWRCADETYRTFLDQGVISSEADGSRQIFGTLLDVTERRQLEDQLMRSRRLDAVGKLTGGIAHDFNNLLAAVLSGLGLLERRMKLDEGSAQVVQMMRHAATQGNELINRMLAFSSRQRLKPDAVRLSSIAETIRGLVAPVLGGLIQFKWEIDGRVWPIYVDAGQLELALMNLIFNARDAMPSGGTISVGAANRSLALATGDLQAGDYVVVTVKDTGSGIPPDLIAKVVEPFFTTKTVGKGTGLGLSTVYGFARQSGGTLKISSEVGRGTQMEIWLPRSASEPVTAKPVEVPMAKRKRWKNEKQPVILLVDDSSSLREITAKVLRDRGLEVVGVSGGAAALVALEHEPQRFDLILTDFAMPLISGLEVIHFARRLRPGWPAILFSGYAELNEVGDRPADVPLVSKPFSETELLEIIRNTLDKASATVAILPESAVRG